MIRRVKYRWKKNLDDATLAAQQDACMCRPNDNPYRPGTAEHAVYDHAYYTTLKHLEPEEMARGYCRIPKRRGAIRKQYLSHRHKKK